MLNEIQQTKEKLVQAGVKDGQRIAILSEPSCEFFAFTLACWKIGAVVVPLSTRCPAAKILDMLKNCQAHKLFVETGYGGMELPVEVFELSDFAGDHTPQTSPILFDELTLDPDADASIIFTSGSSGEPKGVLHTIGNHYYSALGSHENIPFGKGHAWLASLPMYHISGFSLITRSLIAGGTILFPAPGESLTASVMNPAVTHLSLVPTQLMQLLDNCACVERLKQMDAILAGGSAVPSTLIDRSLQLELPVCTTYGSTEAASQIATGKPGKKANVKILPHRDVKVAPDGEILTKGKTLFKGYAKPEHIDPARDTDGWYHTGDTGALDEKNCLTVTGRKDLMFISGGENIHPEEIERGLLNIPNIEQAIVVPTDDPQFGKRPTAFIKTKDNVPLDPEQIKNALTESLEPFKIPKTFHPWPTTLQEYVKPSRQSLQEIAGRLHF